MTDRELLALLLAAKRFRPYLHGQRTTVRTDHSALVDLHMQPGHSPRRLRWIEQLQAFDLHIEHVPGDQNVVADTLSRPPLLVSDLNRVGDAHVDSELTLWLATVAPNLSLSQCALSAELALKAGRSIAAIRCPSCSCLHLDIGNTAKLRRIEHSCVSCAHVFKHAPAVVGNPLGVLGPRWHEGSLYVSRLPVATDSVPQSHRLASLAVEPNFVASLSRHTLASTDPAIVALRG